MYILSGYDRLFFLNVWWHPLVCRVGTNGQMTASHRACASTLRNQFYLPSTGDYMVSGIHNGSTDDKDSKSDENADVHDTDIHDTDAHDAEYYDVSDAQASDIIQKTDEMLRDDAVRTDALEERLEPRLYRHKKRRELADGFKRNKVINEVLDRPAIMTLYKMINDGVLSGVNGSISAGKESLVFWGLDGEGADVALKIYLVSTSNFKRRQTYMQGDPRFSSVRRGTRNIVYAWAKKEYKNLLQCAAAGIPVPIPIRVANNVLAMEFVGDGPHGRPAPRLVDCRDITYNDYEQAVSILRGMYCGARLVHGDYSEYNIFKVEGRGLVVFDLGSAVDLRHPGSDQLLQRDLDNITRFFKKRGVNVETDTASVMGEITR